MNVKSHILSELDRLAPILPGSPPASLVVALPSGRLVADVTALDALACSVLRLAVETPRLAQATTEQLRHLAAQLSTRLNYLLEPIRTIETDPDACVVQMRSQPPQQDEDGTRYYEVLARRGGELCLVRYRKLPGESRQTIPATFTREVFCRLANDLSSVIP
jgi:hypothetical protein